VTPQSQPTLNETAIELLVAKVETIVAMLRDISAPTVRSAIPGNLGIGSRMLDEHAVLLFKLDLPDNNATTYLFVHPSGDLSQVKVYNNVGTIASRDNRVQPLRHEMFPRVDDSHLAGILAAAERAGGGMAMEVALTGADNAIVLLKRRR